MKSSYLINLVIPKFSEQVGGACSEIYFLIASAMSSTIIPKNTGSRSTLEQRIAVVVIDKAVRPRCRRGDLAAAGVVEQKKARHAAVSSEVKSSKVGTTPMASGAATRLMALG